jgi:hypothetical protein
MTDEAAALKRRAQARYARIAEQRAEPRYQRVLGRFVEAGVLITNEQAKAHAEPIRVADALWAGELEPRILELVPALLIKKPSFFADPKALPDDLASVVRALKHNQVPEAFRGIPGADLARWVPRIGRRDKLPSRLRCFRFSAEDSRHLAHLARQLGLNESDVLRRALRELAFATLARADTDSLTVSEPRRESHKPRKPRSQGR